MVCIYVLKLYRAEQYEEAVNTTHALLSMMDLNGNAKPNTGDNFWQKKIRDW